MGKMMRGVKKGRYLWGYINDDYGVSIRGNGVETDIVLKPGQDYKSLYVLMHVSEALTADRKAKKRKKK